MNRQPYHTPPRWWAPKMSPFWIRCCSVARRRTLQRQQKFVEIEIEGLDIVRDAIDSGAGILITPNHSFHYDSYLLLEAADRLKRPFHTLTAWQVFAMSSRFEQWSLQKHGCFSIDRESADLQAFRKSVEIVQQSPHPLVVFPEGDIYHTNDRITPFREGAAAIALGAAKRAERRICCIPAALKCWYVDDPTYGLLQIMSQLERELYWRPRLELSLPERVYRFADGLLALKEMEYLNQPRLGPVQPRARELSWQILERLETHHAITKPAPNIPDRVKELRKRIIKRLEEETLTLEARTELTRQMEDVFLVMQLFSYPGDYVAEHPSLERIAETLDKFEEDVLEGVYPKVRGSRRVVLKFGEPIEVSPDRDKDATAKLTSELHGRVQGMINELNAARPARMFHSPLA